MKIELDGEDVEQVQHLQCQEENGEKHDADGQDLSEVQPTAPGLEASQDQPQNVERGESEHQNPEDVVDVAFFFSIELGKVGNLQQKDHKRLVQPRGRGRSDCR